MPQMSPMNWATISMAMSLTLLMLMTTESMKAPKKSNKKYHTMKNVCWSW